MTHQRIAEQSLSKTDRQYGRMMHLCKYFNGIHMLLSFLWLLTEQSLSRESAEKNVRKFFILDIKKYIYLYLVI
jgi:hypothetical protein